MIYFGNAAGFLSCRACGVPLSTPFGRSCPHLLRYHHHYSSHSHDVACGHSELEVLIDALHPPIHGLADATYGLAPADVPSGACVNRAAAAPGSVARHMRGHIARTTVGDKVGRVIGFVRCDGLGSAPRNGIKHCQRRGSFPHSIGMRHHRPHHQPGAILHEHMALVAKYRGGVVTLSEQSLGRTLFWPAHAWISVPSTEKCSFESSPALSASVITSVKNDSITSFSSNRSRFFENTEWSHTVSSMARPTNQRNSRL